jgi:hypothetical protein
VFAITLSEGLSTLPVIDYPGNICLGVDRVISLNPIWFRYGWQFLFASLTAFLLGSTLYKKAFPEKVAAHNRKWLFSSALFVVVVCLGVLILRIPNLVFPERNPEESQWIVSAASYFQGAVMWKTLGGDTSGPLVFIPLNIMVFFGGLNYASIRLFGLLFCVLPSFYFTWKTLRLLYGEIAARLSLILLFIFFSSMNLYDFIAYNGEHVPMVLTTAGAWFYFSYVKHRSMSLSKMMLLGIVLGLFPYAKLQAVPIGFVIGLLTIFLIVSSEIATRKKGKYLAMLVTGALVPTFLVIGYLAVHECWSSFFDSYIHQNLQYVDSGLLGKASSGLGKFALLPLMVLENRDFLFFIICPLSLIVVMIAAVWKSGFLKNLFCEKNFIASALILVAAYVSVNMPGNKFIHYTVLFIFPFILLVGILIGHLLDKEIHLGKKYGMSYILSAYLFYSAYVLVRPAHGFEYISKGTGYQISDASKAIKKYAFTNEQMSIWGWAAFYFVETGLVLGNQHPTPYYALMGSADNNQHLSKYVNELKTNQPVIFLDATSKDGFIFNNPSKYKHENYPELHTLITKYYTGIGEFQGNRVYVLRERFLQVRNYKAKVSL